MKNVRKSKAVLLLCVLLFLTACSQNSLFQTSTENETEMPVVLAETYLAVVDAETQPYLPLVVCQDSFASGISLNETALDGLKSLYEAMQNCGLSFTVQSGYYDLMTAETVYNQTYLTESASITSHAYALLGGTYISANYAKTKVLSPLDAVRVTEYVVGTAEKDEHRLGTVVTLSNDITADSLAYFQTHACEYGFICRYPSGKEALTGRMADVYTYRYVGIGNATYLYQNNRCFEEISSETR